MAARKKIGVQCSRKVNKSDVKRTTIGGVEHIIVASATLPDNVVMNGIMYPADEIEKSYMTLDRTLAPLGHPVDEEGRFLPANDPVAINNFYAGAFNTNVRRENGRVFLDKTINVQEAQKSERGKRLLDRINELETSKDPRPIHTSTGLFVEIEELDEPQVNAAGMSYRMIAREMLFDHDAILLDEIGAATPEQGVGIGVNAKGEQINVEQINVDVTTELSFWEIEQRLMDALRTPPLSADWIQAVYSDRVIYELNDQLFTVPYTLSQDIVTITGIPIAVTREVKFTPNQNGDKAMKEKILAKLKEAKVNTEGMTDDQLLEAYEKLNEPAAPEPATNADDLASVVAAALAPISEELGKIKSQLNANTDAEKAQYIQTITNSDRYPGLTEDVLKTMAADTLKTMAANCQPAMAIPLPAFTADNNDPYDFSKAEMPK